MNAKIVSALCYFFGGKSVLHTATSHQVSSKLDEKQKKSFINSSFNG